jgi:hypothetical protein
MKNQLIRQIGSRNLMGPKTLPTIWYTYMMLVTKYQISAKETKEYTSFEETNFFFLNLKTLPTIWYTYMMLVTKYQISANV